MRDGKGDAETYYQYARSYLLDFYQQQEPAKRRVSLNLAMEALATVLKRNPDHIPAMKAKAIIHARAELLHYDPNLAYELSSRVAKLEPNASEFLLTVTDWMSGEVRFTAESGHRVPHDPLVGLDRSIDLLEQVMDSSMPFSNVESSSFYQMGTTLARRGNFKEAVHYFKLTLARGVTPEQRMASLREMGTAYYRMGEYEDAAATFYQALQLKMNPVDQWLLRVSMDQLRSKPPIPKQYVFERPEPSLSRTGAPLLAFEDIAPALGVNRFDGNGTCGWGDYDGDGDLDLFLAGSGTFIAVFRNDGGKFVEVTETVGLAKVPSGYSLNLIDYDNDGRTDLYISYNGWSGPMKNRLYHNEGGRFADVSAASGADDAGSGFSCMWADLDNDGWLDFAVANGVLRDGSTPQIYRNNRNGTFTNMTRQAGIDEPPTYGAIGLALGDYDRDGKVDLLINGLDPAPNRLYHNDGNWHFTEVSEKAGVIQPIHNGFVCFFFDYNNDGWPDLMTTSLAAWDAVVEGLRKGYSPKGLSRMNPDASRLFRNNKNGSFTDVTFEAGLYHPMGVMGAGVADLDNDGFVDIYFGVGDPQISRLEPNRFFRNNGDGTFSDLTDVVGFQRPGNKGHGVSFVDIDEDGDLDVYAQLGGHYPGDWAYNAFYKNLNGNQNNWLQVDLRSTKSNRNAIGAQLTVRCGEWLVYREVKGSEGFGATNQFRQHFGLGKRPKVDLIEIHWPSGVIQKIDGLDANQFIEVTEGGGWRRLK
ncbi:MAG: VCBS repeat-containing protein [Acidobacteria bacterium]|nr:VCBS repeat-containing protein [Acidobacteriota bacterium]